MKLRYLLARTGTPNIWPRMYVVKGDFGPSQAHPYYEKVTSCAELKIEPIKRV